MIQPLSSGVRDVPCGAAVAKGVVVVAGPGSAPVSDVDELHVEYVFAVDLTEIDPGVLAFALGL